MQTSIEAVETLFLLKSVFSVFWDVAGNAQWKVFLKEKRSCSTIGNDDKGKYNGPIYEAKVQAPFWTTQHIWSDFVYFGPMEWNFYYLTF